MKSSTNRAKFPNYKGKMHQKQWASARANSAETRKSNKPKITYTERMGKLQQLCDLLHHLWLKSGMSEPTVQFFQRRSNQIERIPLQTFQFELSG